MAPTRTDYSAITLIVVKLELRKQAEQAAVAADPEGGAGTFLPGVPLRAKGDATNTVAAVWARWNMKPSQQSSFATTMGGPNNLYAAGQSVNRSRDRWFFDATAGAWTPQQVLDALGFDRLAIDDPGEYSPAPQSWP